MSNDLDRLDTAPVEGVRWIHVAGVRSMDVLLRLKNLYSLDALALEDVVNLGQRPKFTEYGNNLFVTLLKSSRICSGTSTHPTTNAAINRLNEVMRVLTLIARRPIQPAFTRPAST